MVAGPEENTEGQKQIGTRNVTREDPADRRVAMVFQTYAFYLHITVAQIIGFRLKMILHLKTKIQSKVAEKRRILKLDDYLDQNPQPYRAFKGSVWQSEV